MVQVSQYVPILFWGQICSPSPCTKSGLVLTTLPRHSITIHYYKISGTIGVSSAYSPSRQSFTPTHLRSYRPEAQYHCDVNSDPFTFMRENKKTYGPFLFSCIVYVTNQPISTPLLRVHALHAGRREINSVAVAHRERCVHPLPAACRPARSYCPRRAEFIERYPQYVTPNDAMDFLSDNGGVDYNMCQCMSVSISASYK